MQKNPYEVLGISPNATDEQIKDAYRRLARRYQTNEFGTDPMSDIARQKMRELDEAYDEIMQHKRRPSGGAYSRGASTGAGQSHTGRQSSFPDIRAKISSNRIDDAQVLLDGVLPEGRNAEWHYLKGLISQQRGWFDEAENYFSTACQMEPSNIEYAAAYNRVRNNRTGGYRTARGFGTGGGGRQCSACDICTGLLCADCCCECMGGDCIPCC